MQDEDFCDEARALVWENSKKRGQANMTSKDFADYVNTTLLPKYSDSTSQLSISPRTARTWLHKLGFDVRETKRALYIDGHERADVVLARIEYLESMRKYRWRMVHNEPSDAEKILFATLPKEKRPLIIIYQDESTFHANDDQRTQWCDDTMRTLRHKSIGRGIMVSGWLNEITGCLPGANAFLKYGKNEEGYWTAERMEENVKNVIRIFEQTFPWAQALFVFDNSSNHKKMASNALNAHVMNLNPGGKQPVMHATTYNGKHQEMVIESGEHKKEPKGLKIVLQERGLWPSQGLKKKAAQDLLSKCEDFVNEPTILIRTVLDSGHLAIYLPKFHCDLNPIEMLWCDAKKDTRAHCTYSFKDLQEQVPSALARAVQDKEHLKKLFNITQQLEAIYPRVTEGELPDKIRRTYFSHRRTTAVDVVDEKQAARWALTQSDICPCFKCSPTTHKNPPFGPDAKEQPAVDVDPHPVPRPAASGPEHAHQHQQEQPNEEEKSLTKPANHLRNRITTTLFDLNLVAAQDSEGAYHIMAQLVFWILHSISIETLIIKDGNKRN